MTRLGVAIEQMTRLTDDEQADLMRLAARLGYESAWTPAPAALERDAFQICLRWWEAARAVRGGMTVGIAVVPLPFWTVPALAVAAGTLASMTGGRFILGVGPSAIHIPSFRARYGVARVSPVELVRDHLRALRPMLRGDHVSNDGATLRLADAWLAFHAPAVPLYMSAMGPRMLELAGELSDGVCLNWCTTDEIARSRATVEVAAVGAKRPTGSVQVVQSIRVSLDPDPEVARRRLARTILHYALARPGSSPERGYRGHFARMGFDARLRALERMREEGASDAVLADAFPAEVLSDLAYFGVAAGARSAVERLSRGLDLALIRPVVAPGDAAGVAAVFEACA